MPRIARNQLPPEGIYHVTARGVAGLPLYVDDVDRLDFMSLLGTVRKAAPFRIHAYCLMTTHYHLVAESRLRDLSSALHALNGRYAMRFNRRHERHGHLFESRYSAWVVRDDAHYEAACRYVLDNPVRAGLGTAANPWPWVGLEPR